MFRFIAVVTGLLMIGGAGHYYFKSVEAEDNSVSELLWKGYVNGVKNGCGSLVYSIDGQTIPEEISIKLYEFDRENKLCEKLYYEAVKAARKNGLKLSSELVK